MWKTVPIFLKEGWGIWFVQPECRVLGLFMMATPLDLISDFDESLTNNDGFLAGEMEM
jgi:hypothetical protein